MSVVDLREELLPLRTEFDLRWRGYDRDQVQHYARSVEDELRLLTADRDAALAHAHSLARADSLARQLEAARTEIAELRARVDRICRTPIDPDALTERLRHSVELAHSEATEITTRARAAAEQHWTNAKQAVDRLRGRAEHLVADLDRRRADTETEHCELMARAHEQVDTLTRRELDDQAAHGCIAVLAVITSAAEQSQWVAGKSPWQRNRTSVVHVVAASPVCLLKLLDDVSGDGSERSWPVERAHARIA